MVGTVKKWTRVAWRESGGMCARFETEFCGSAPCICWHCSHRRWCPVWGVRHACGVHPKRDSPCTFYGSALGPRAKWWVVRVGRGAPSWSRTDEIQHDAKQWPFLAWRWWAPSASHARGETDRSTTGGQPRSISGVLQQLSEAHRFGDAELSCIRVDSADLSMSQVQQIVDSLLPDVPVQRTKKAPEVGYELLVVDRDAFALELAREWVRSGLPRSSVRWRVVSDLSLLR